MDKKNQVQILADIIQPLMQQIDLLTSALSTEDFKLLDEAKETLSSHINFKQSAAPVVLAFGGSIDTTDEEYKLKSLELLIEIMKTRIKYREELIELEEKERIKKDNLEMLKNMGLF